MFEIIEIVETERDMLQRERFWIKCPAAVFNVKKYSMQIKFSSAQRSAELKRRWADPTFRAKMIASISVMARTRKRKPHSAETREKIAAANRARGVEQIGKKISEEICAKMSSSRLGKKRGPYKPETRPRRTKKYLNSLLNLER